MEHAALLVIDAQRIYTDPESDLACAESVATIADINRLVDAFAVHRRPIVFVRHVHRADGSDLGRMFDFAGEAGDFNFKDGSDEVDYTQGLNRPLDAIEVTKTRYSAFQRTNLDETLRRLGVTRVVVCGFMTNLCCESTAREAHDRDYYVSFVPDATGCPELPGLSQDEIRRLVSAFLEAGFATIVSTGEVVEALRG